MSASCSAVKKLSGVAVPSCSWGSSQRDAKPACHARTILPLAAAPAGDENGVTVDAATIRNSTTASTRIMSGPPLGGSVTRGAECRRLARGLGGGQVASLAKETARERAAPDD